MELASDLSIGGSGDGATYGWPPQKHNFRGSVAMLQLYASEASAELDIQCVFDGGKELVQNQRMALDAPSECRGRISTGCTNKNADNFDPALPADAIDDGSCEFAQHEAVEGEHGVIHVTDDWQRVDLSRSYSNPVVLCGVVTRDSTTEAVVRVRSVTTDPRTGLWYFEIRAEQKSCHSADPPPTSEHVDFIVVEAGVSVEGWQAGLTRVHNADWHRISFLQETAAGVQPVVISQVQTYDNRTKFVSTRHYFPPPGFEAESNFVGVDLEMEWPDAREYCRAHYHDLASIHSAQENVLAVKECEKTRNHQLAGGWFLNCYIGVNDIQAEGTYVWSDGSALNYANWNPGEPNDYNANGDGITGEDWGVLSTRSREGVWNDNGPFNNLNSGEWGDKSVGFICERAPGSSLHVASNATQSQQRHLAFFLKLQGEGVWCQDGQFFAEYFDSLDLSGTPHATQCETDVPSWQWHSTNLGADAVPGVPPILVGTIRNLAPELFSARWTARMNQDQGDEYVFSSHANKGSRIIIDSATILDRWEECCSTFSSEPLRLSAGVHVVMYEYRSGYTPEYAPVDSYAELSWSAAEGGTVGAGLGSNSTNITSTAEELFADVGWLACSPGSGAIHSRSFQSGLTVVDATLATIVEFGSAFSVSPRIFAAVVSDADLSSHLRLTATAMGQAAVAVEYVRRQKTQPFGAPLATVFLTTATTGGLGVRQMPQRMAPHWMTQPWLKFSRAHTSRHPIQLSAIWTGVGYTAGEKVPRQHCEA
eukprot:COSAG06_NODE_340_length_17187_cov_578.135475_1_plen_764_part_00